MVHTTLIAGYWLSPYGSCFMFWKCCIILEDHDNLELEEVLKKTTTIALLGPLESWGHRVKQSLKLDRYADTENHTWLE